MNLTRQSALWDAINEYAAACSGDTSDRTISDRRMDAVVAVERLLGTPPYLSENPMNQDTAHSALAEPAPRTPWDIIHEAVSKGMDADQLGKLTELHERWLARRAAEAYAVAMQACQAEMPAVLRTKKGENSKYAPLEEVHEVIKPVYLRHGFSLSFTELPGKEGSCNLACDVRHTAGHVQRHTLEGGLDVAGPKGGATKTPIQGKGSSVSYLRRYLTLLIFNVTVQDEDRDGMSASRLVGPEEIKALNDLMAEIPFFAKPANVDRLMKWVGVETWDQLPLRDFAKVVNELNRQRKKGGAV